METQDIAAAMALNLRETTIIIAALHESYLLHKAEKEDEIANEIEHLWVKFTGALQAYGLTFPSTIEATDIAFQLLHALMDDRFKEAGNGQS